MTDRITEIRARVEGETALFDAREVGWTSELADLVYLLAEIETLTLMLDALDERPSLRKSAERELVAKVRQQSAELDAARAENERLREANERLLDIAERIHGVAIAESKP